MVDAAGAYRAQLELSLDNSSEQFLDVQLPEGATLWTVHVAGEPVKPGRVPGASGDRHVLLPVRKTAKGDVNYLVVLKYGGKMPPLSAFSTVDFPLVRDVKSYSRQTAIGIERSQVKVYVPKTRQWFDFGGTMRRSEDEADLEAGRMAAFNKQGERLIEATQDKDPFARLRATNNLKSWVAESQKTQQENPRVANSYLQSQYAANYTTAQQAQEALKSVEGKEQKEKSAEDNRERLNDLYQRQGIVNAKGSLILTGSNTYNGGTVVSGGQLSIGNGGEFNGNWIARNNLANNDITAAQQPPNGPAVGGQTLPSPFYLHDDVQYYPQGGQGAAITKSGAGTVTPGGPNNITGATSISAGSAIQLNQPNAYAGTTNLNGAIVQNANPNFGNGGRVILGNAQPPAGQVMGGSMTGAGGGGLGGMQPLAPAPPPANYAAPYAPRGYAPAQQPGPPVTVYESPTRRKAAKYDQKQELAEYQEKLSKDNAVQGSYTIVGNGVTTPFSVSINNPVQAADQTAGDQKKVTQIGAGFQNYASTFEKRGSIAAGATGVPGGPIAPGGLASLDFEMPIDAEVYGLYRFTTPLGEAELTARSVANSTLGRLEFLVGVVAACLAIWVAWRLVRSGALNWFRRPVGATLLTVVGLASLCSGLLPVVGLLAFCLGVGLLIAHFWKRRAVAYLALKE